jgi:hypothetical protein
MPLSAACSRVQEASDGTCPLGEPGGSSPASISSGGEHGAASGCAHTGDLLAIVGGVSRGGASCPTALSPAFAARRGGAPRVCREESLLLLALLRTLWCLSCQELHDWLCAWPALALACGLPLEADGWPRVPAQQSKRLRAAGEQASEMLFVLLERAGLWMGLTRACDLIIDSAPILAWQAGRPDLIRSPRLVLAHVWEGMDC